jgi:hypothetical protein
MATAAVGLMLAAVWTPAVAHAAPAADSCIAGLPPDLTSQFEPLLQALCETNQSGVQSTNQKDLELIAEAMALLALADPGYGYGYPPTSYTLPSVPPAATEPPAPQVMPQTDDTPAEPPPDEVPACGSGPP